MFNFYPVIKSSASIAAALLITAASIPMASAADGGSCKLAGQTMTCTWESGTDELQLPDGTTSVTFELWGAQGGTTIPGAAEGGKGGYTKASMTKPVSGWKPLQINVGGAGKSVSGEPSGGSNGGGEASSYLRNPGGGGGGASAISLLPGDLHSRILVAGGGGGASGGRNGGAGGGLYANAGEGPGAGTGATQAVPGHGTPDSSCSRGHDGAFGQGGNAVSCYPVGSGGGGGGLYGGGGGTDNSGGGGGSSYVNDAHASVTEMTKGTNQGNGKVVATFILTQ